jgi:hypothetical protein
VHAMYPLACHVKVSPVFMRTLTGPSVPENCAPPMLITSYARCVAKSVAVAYSVAMARTAQSSEFPWEPAPSVTHMPSLETWQKTEPERTAHMCPGGTGGAGEWTGGGGKGAGGGGGGNVGGVSMGLSEPQMVHPPSASDRAAGREHESVRAVGCQDARGEGCGSAECSAAEG